MLTKVAEVRVSALRANLLALGVAIPLILLCLLLAQVLGYRPGRSVPDSIPLAILVFLPIAVIHELLHAAAALVHGRLRRTDIHIGINWKALALVCNIKVPVRVRTARVVGITPLAVTGPLTVAVFVLYPSYVTAWVTAFTLIGGLVDLFMLHKLRPFDGELLFVDHPGEPAFEIYASTPDFDDQP